MKSCKLSERVTLLPPMNQPDQYGNKVQYPDPSSPDLSRAWATVKPVKEVEQVTGQAVYATGHYTIYIRYRTDLKSTWRLAWRGKLLDINGITPDQKRTMLIIDAIENLGAEQQPQLTIMKKPGIVGNNFGIL